MKSGKRMVSGFMKTEISDLNNWDLAIMEWKNGVWRNLYKIIGHFRGI